MNSRSIALPLLLLFPLLCKEAGATGLCSHGETTLFSCHSEDKQLSLCASQASNSSEPFVQYRYGTSSRIELRFPEKKISPQEIFLESRAGGKYGTSHFINFVIGEDRYVIYYLIDSNSGRDLERAGVAILKDADAKPKEQFAGERPAKSFRKLLQCKRPWTPIRDFPDFGSDDYYDFPREITSKLFGYRK